MSTPYEQAARQRKATVLAAAVRSHLPGVPAAELAAVAEVLGDETWLELARIAGVRPPSQASRVAVIAHLRAEADGEQHAADYLARVRARQLSFGGPEVDL